MSYNLTYFGGAAPGQPPSQYGQNYAQGQYNVHYSTSPQNGSYGAQYSAAAAPPHAQSSGLRQQSYYQSGNYLAPGPAHDGRTSFDSASPIVYSSNPQDGGNCFVQSRGPSNKTSATGTHKGGCNCTIM